MANRDIRGTSEPLVPKGLPQGSRQRTRAAMQRANIPLSPTGDNRGGVSGALSPQGQPATTDAPLAPVDLLAQTTPDDFPFIGQPQPDAQPADQPDSVIRGLAAGAQSTFGAAVLSRLQSRRRR